MNSNQTTPGKQSAPHPHGRAAAPRALQAPLEMLVLPLHSRQVTQYTMEGDSASFACVAGGSPEIVWHPADRNACPVHA